MRTDFQLIRQPAASAMPAFSGIAARDRSEMRAETVAANAPVRIADFNPADLWATAFDGHLSVFRKG